MVERKTTLVHTEAAASAESTTSPGDLVQKHRGAISSAVEHRFHTAGVSGSKPLLPTVPDHIADMLADDAWRMNVEERFWPKVAKLLDWSACWIWLASKERIAKGKYGTFKLKSYVTSRAHRVAYALYYGRSPGELLVCHTCDNPQCVNPSHLFLGTVQDNSDDMVRKGRASKQDQRGERNKAAKLSAEQIETIRDLIRANLTNTAIAARYGVTHQAISRIRRGRSWGDEPMQAPYASLKPRPLI
jgi:hypothetical protein